MKNSESITIERWVIATILVAFFGIFVAVGCSAFIASPTIAIAIGILFVVGLTPLVAKKLSTNFDGLYSKKRLIALLWLVLSIAALVRTGGVALYMADQQQPQASAMWFNDFYVNHSCLSGYWKSAQLAMDGDINIYEDEPYSGFEGRFKLDNYLYPPQFLILPQTANALGVSFLQERAIWFALDAALLATTMLALCIWIGGSAGRKIALLLPAMWLATPTLITLQTGNFQLAVLSLSMLAMLLFEKQKTVAGGALLGFAVFKIFPGILCAYLLFTQRWKALFWTVAFSVIYTGVAFAVMGSKPFSDFIFFEWPKMASGELWSWLEIQGLENVVAINNSIPGLVLKLKLMGIPAMDWHLMTKVGWVWTLLVLAFTFYTAKRNIAFSRLQQTQVWIVILGLAALRSPFVPDDYGLFPALWALCLVFGSITLSSSRIILLSGLWIAFGTVMPISFGENVNYTPTLLISTISQLLAIGFCIHLLFNMIREDKKANSEQEIQAGITAPALEASGN